VTVFLTGIGCVGKTAIGGTLAQLMNRPFYDLDEVIEAYFDCSIRRLHARFLTMHSYRREAVKALIHLLNKIRDEDAVVALPPSGLMYPFGREVHKTGGLIVVLRDTPQSILERITFYDDDSNRIDVVLTGDDKRLYLREIKKDWTYFKRTYQKAHMTVDIAGLDVLQSANKLKRTLEQARGM